MQSNVSRYLIPLGSWVSLILGLISNLFVLIGYPSNFALAMIFEGA